MRTLFAKTFRLLVPFLWKNRASRIATITTIGLTLADTLAHIVELRLFGYIFDHCKEFSLPGTLTLIALLIFLWHACMTLPYFRKISFFPVLNQAARDIRLRTVTHLHQVPLQTWENYNKPQIISASTRVSHSVRDFMEALFVEIIPALVTLITSSIALLHFNYQIWYFPLLILCTYFLAYGSISRFLKSRQKAWESNDQVYTAMNDSLQNTKFAQFHLAEENQRLSHTFDAEAREWRQNNFLQHWTHIVQDTLFFLLAGGLLVHMIILYRSDLLSLAQLFAIKNYIWRMHNKMRRVTTHSRILFTSLIDLKKILGLLDLPARKAATSPSWTPTAADKPILQLRNVSFSHAQQPAIFLQNKVSLDIWPGEHVAILGPSGAGKSTLCHLLTGLYTPQQGEVLLSGMPMNQLSLTNIGRYVHFVDQEANLINGTILDNLGAEPTATQTTPLANLKDRLKETTGDGGKKLSSGEKQRVLLARCLSYKPEVLILDETLSALDEASAQSLLQFVLKSVPTVILVTHRESLVKGFKHIYRLEAGQLQSI